MDIIEHNRRLNPDSEWWYTRYPAEFEAIVNYQKAYWGDRVTTTSEENDFIVTYLNTSIEEHQAFIESVINDDQMRPIHESINEWANLNDFVVTIDSR